MAKSLVAVGTAAVLGTATLTTSNPAAAQPWLLPVVAGFLAGAFVGGATASPYPYYSPYASDRPQVAGLAMTQRSSWIRFASSARSRPGALRTRQRAR